MNFLGHAAVALGCGRDSDEEVLGAVLPDLLGMAGLRLDRTLLDASILSGMDCHHATDTAFHSHPAFVRGSASIRKRLEAMHVAAGPRRAVAHVGWELMLDGEVAKSDAVTEAFRAALVVATRPMAGLDPRWATFAARLNESEMWCDYQDPDRVARRLDAILARRPRLAMADGDVGAVAEVLRSSHAGVQEAASTVVAEVIAAVAGGSRVP